ncbi:hypothetical protein SOPP22_09070 [Shewanella sp. OPT22]|nr:hypothetical protein SOPP22_09070 [Shewanella sp. OPT22]
MATSINPQQPLKSPNNLIYWNEKESNFDKCEGDVSATQQLVFSGEHKNKLCIECKSSHLPKHWGFKVIGEKVKSTDGSASVVFIRPDFYKPQDLKGKKAYFTFIKDWNIRMKQKAAKQRIELPFNFNPNEEADKYFASEKGQTAESPLPTGVEQEDIGDFASLTLPAQPSVQQAPNKKLNAATTAFRRKIIGILHRRLLNPLMESELKETSGTIDNFVIQCSKEQQQAIQNSGFTLEMSSEIEAADIGEFLLVEQWRISRFNQKPAIIPVCINGPTLWGSKRQHTVVAVVSENGFCILDSKRPFYEKHLPSNCCINTGIQSNFRDNNCTKYAAHTINSLVATFAQLQNKDASMKDFIKSFNAPTKAELSTIFSESE